MEILETIRDWISEKFEENLENLAENLDSIKDNFGNIFLSLILLIVGFQVLKDYPKLILIFYSITAIWIFLFNTLVLIEKPAYFLIVLIVLLVNHALFPLLIGGWNLALKGELLSALIYLLVWVDVRMRFNQLKK